MSPMHNHYDTFGYPTRFLEHNPIPSLRGLTVAEAEREFLVLENVDIIDGFVVKHEVDCTVPDIDCSMRHSEVLDAAQRWEQA